MNRSESEKSAGSRLSLLFIDSERNWRGGQAQLFTLLQGLHRRGHTIHLVCFPGTSLEEKARKLGILVHPIAIRTEVGLISLLRLLFTFRKTRPDILAFNTPKPILAGTLASKFAPVGARIIFRRVSFPLGHSCLSRLKYTWGIDCVIAISRSIKRQLMAGGVPDSRIEIIYEGIDLNQYPKEAIQEAHPEGAPVTIGTVSHLSHEKGLRYLIEAASLIPDVRDRIRFVIVGDGVCRPELEALVREKGMNGCFQFMGFRSDSHLIMKTFDLFVLPSLSEGLSSAIIEAMSNSLPVVASDVGGIPELIQNGHNGILVPPGDAGKLALAIRQLAGDAETSRRMGEKGRKRVEEEFALERKIEETEKLCRSLLGGTSRTAEGDRC
jgi:glycosyltransferase involved in cell wall biosynthesis